MTYSDISVLTDFFKFNQNIPSYENNFDMKFDRCIYNTYKYVNEFSLICQTDTDILVYPIYLIKLTKLKIIHVNDLNDCLHCDDPCHNNFFIRKYFDTISKIIIVFMVYADIYILNTRKNYILGLTQHK